MKLTSEGIGGIAANRKFIVVGSRNVTDTSDVFTCHSLSDGKELWRIKYRAKGKLDYGNSPRATPQLIDDKVVLLGAFGNLIVAELATGEIAWQKDFRKDFDAELPTWGFSGSPLIVASEKSGKKKRLVIVQPGTESHSLVAFDLESGELVWNCPGTKPSYSSFILMDVQGQQQIVGYDKTTLGGWSVDGKRLWTLTPENSGDFNVPTPIVLGDRLFVTTENNGARVYQFDKGKKLETKALASNKMLAPDTHSPVRVGDMICGTCAGLVCIETKTMKPVHEIVDEAFDEYTAAISDGKNRVLVVTLNAELILVTVNQKSCKITSRLQVAEDDEIMSHPALVGNQLIFRLGRKLVCMPLD